jgi:hypothetical protein
VHLRRALLLFAIVLGLAAVAASVSRPRTDSDGSAPLRTPSPSTEQDRSPTTGPAPEDSSPVALTFFAADPSAQRIRAGQAATVSVEVQEAGQVDIADLGMTATAEPLTPARFDVLTRATGRHPITFLPAGDEAAVQRLGTLVVVE